MIYIQNDRHGIMAVQQVTEFQTAAGWKEIDIDKYLKDKAAKSKKARFETIQAKEDAKIEAEQALHRDMLIEKWSDDPESMTRNELLTYGKFVGLKVSISQTKDELIKAIKNESTDTDKIIA